VNRSALKSQINISTLTTRAQRREASRLIISGRKLRAKGRALADAPTTKVKADRLLKQGWDNHKTGMSLLGDAEAGRNDRRHASLAAALLNGKTYLRCEPKINPAKTPKVDAEMLAGYIKPHLPLEEQKHALHIAEMWAKDGHVRLAYIREQGLVRLLHIDKKEAEVVALKAKIGRAEQDFQHQKRQESTAQARHASQVKRREASADELYALQSRLADLELELEDAKTVKADQSATINSIDDLLEAA